MNAAFRSPKKKRRIGTELYPPAPLSSLWLAEHRVIIEMVLILLCFGSHSAVTAVDQGDRHQQINSSVWRGLKPRCCRYAHHVSASLPYSVWLTLLHFRATADWAVPGRRARSATCERTRTRQRRDDSGNVYAGEAPSSRSPRQWFLTFVFDQRAVELCRNIQCIDRAKNLHLDTIARLIVPESRLSLPPLSIHQHLCVLCFRFIILINSPLGH